MKVLGIDVGGTGIKGAPINLKKQKYMAERHRIDTPRPATPEAIGKTVKEIVDHFNWDGPIGVGFPTVMINGCAVQHSNLNPAWQGVQVDDVFREATGLPVTVINDADAAGLAEMKYGVGKGKKGLVITLTLGTGLGSGLFYNGKLVPNFELGQLVYKGSIIEKFASRAVRRELDLSFDEWGERLDIFLNRITNFCSPELFIIGGGASKYFDEFAHKFTVDVPILPAQMQNRSGIIGAAEAARQHIKAKIKEDKK